MLLNDLNINMIFLVHINWTHLVSYVYHVFCFSSSISIKDKTRTMYHEYFMDFYWIRKSYLDLDLYNPKQRGIQSRTWVHIDMYNDSAFLYFHFLCGLRTHSIQE